MQIYDVLIVGGGVAGMTAACVLKEKNPECQVLLVERENALGGILRQCIHTGFGVDDLTGPEYKARIEDRLRKTNAEIWLNTEITELKKGQVRNVCAESDLSVKDSKVLIAHAYSINEKKVILFRHLIQATGCYERPIGSLMIGGTRPNGIYGAGELQRMMNLEGFRPVQNARVVIIGSGDIGMIVARRLALHKCRIVRMIEMQEQSPALERNKKRCLEAFQLPLQTNSRVIEIHGESQICGVTVEKLLTGVREYVECDFLVVAAGLIPDRSLTETLEDSILESEITYIGNCEKVYPMAESIVHSVKEKIQQRNFLKLQ